MSAGVDVEVLIDSKYLLSSMHLASSRVCGFPKVRRVRQFVHWA